MTWEAGWHYGIISTVPYEQQKINTQIILFQRIYYLSISLTGLPCTTLPQDMQTRSSVQLAFAKFLSRIKEIFRGSAAECCIHDTGTVLKISLYFR